MKKLNLLFFILSAQLNFVFAQKSANENREIDSLVGVAELSKIDSVQIDIYRTVAIKLAKSNPVKATEYAMLGLKISRKTNYHPGMAKSFLTLGQVYYYKAYYDSSLLYLDSAAILYNKLKNKKGQADVFLQKGTVYDAKAEMDLGLENYIKCEEIRLELKDTAGIISANVGLANIYSDLGKLELAEEHFNKALDLAVLIDDKRSIATAYNNLGTLYSHKKDYTIAKEFYLKSVDVKNEINDRYGMSMTYTNIGIMDYYMGDLKSARNNMEKGLAIREELNDRNGVAQSLSNLGSLSTEMGDYKGGISYFLRAVPLLEEMGDKRTLDAAYMELAKCYKNIGEYKKALDAYEKYIAVHDEIFNENQGKIVEEMSAKFETEKKEKELIEKNAQLQQKEMEAEQQNLLLKQNQLESDRKTAQRNMFIGISFLMLIVVGFAFYSYKQKKKDNLIINEQKREVELQRDIVEEKNKEITDSITYAKRIQNAILPPEKFVKQYLPDSFILYQPKDIVAGDFYWMEFVSGQSKENLKLSNLKTLPTADCLLFAAADCTGHGVPGAMVSVVCNNGLNRSVREHFLTDPGKILDKTREIVISEFEKSEDEVKDGMDISLCALSSDSKTLRWAGANNPLWLIREDKFTEIKADKQPIGKSENPESFTTHEIQLQKGDLIYIFTDGFQDQFGGDKGKKFKSSNFKTLLLSIYRKTMDEQKEIIGNEFKKWKMDLEQVDDVCIIGVRI